MAWWREAVVYQIYVPSFADASGDGVGDLPGVRSKLDHLVRLGVGALWLTPFYPSPMVDHGYDVADPTDVDPRFGTLADFDALVADAHERGLRVLVDVVPNHTSSEHPWFRAALAAPPGAPARQRYIFRPGQRPPNNWRSNFGGSAWTQLPDGEWYLHMFAPEQPDLNWRHPDVPAEFERVLRFWLDRGVDGIRIDVASGLFKDEQLRDNPGPFPPGRFGHGPEDDYSWNRPEVHEIWRQWRRLLDGYPGDRMAIGEVWVRDDSQLADYARPDELHQVFAFKLLRARWDAAELREAISGQLTALARVGALPAWVLSNHDFSRTVTRYGGGERGLARARAAALLMLALPGAAYLYAGEELGLPDGEVAPEDRHDPIWRDRRHGIAGRERARVVMPWGGTTPPFGFSPAGVRPWLPPPPSWADKTVEHEWQDPTSTLALYAAALRARPVFRGALTWREAPAGVLAFSRGSHACLVNVGASEFPLPAGDPILASQPLPRGVLPPDTAVWLSGPA